MTNVIIINDQTHCIDVLRQFLRKIEAGYTITGAFTNFIEGLAYVKKNPPDLLFLEMDMPGRSGLELLNTLRPVDFKVIFTTVNDPDRVKAFEYSAIHYLIKPITEKHMVKVLSSWEKKQKKVSERQWKLLHELLTNKEAPSQIAFPVAEGFKIVRISDIVRCQSDNHYSYIFWENENKTLIGRTLDEIEELLSDHSFLRVHPHHLINTNFVTAILKQDDGSKILVHHTEIPVSRRKVISVRDILIKMIRLEGN